VAAKSSLNLRAALSRPNFAPAALPPCTLASLRHRRHSATFAPSCPPALTRRFFGERRFTSAINTRAAARFLSVRFLHSGLPGRLFTRAKFPVLSSSHSPLVASHLPFLPETVNRVETHLSPRKQTTAHPSTRNIPAHAKLREIFARSLRLERMKRSAARVRARLQPCRNRRKANAALAAEVRRSSLSPTLLSPLPSSGTDCPKAGLHVVSPPRFSARPGSEVFPCR
jgi:hypothetical protein